MTMHLVTPPAIEPVTLADARAFLKLSSTSDDEIVLLLLKVARETVEAKAGLALITQSWRLHVDRWPRSGRLALYRYPAKAVTAITAYNAEGEPVVLSPDEWLLQPGGRPQRLYLSARGDSASLSGLEIEFTAGFCENGVEVPDVLKQAILLLTAHLYEFRGAFDGANQPVSFPPAFERLVDIWKRVSV